MSAAPPIARLRRDPRRLAMAVSLLTSFLMLGGKMAAYFITGSAAIYSDAAESVIHVLATGLVAFGLWYADQPADAQHPYGHGKAAYFASGLEGAFILVAAIAILYTSVRALVEGPALRDLGLGFVFIAALTVVNLALGLYLIRTGRRHNSIVIVSNGQHVLTDMWTSVGVLAGVGLVWLTGLDWLDPIVAILVALNILWMAVRLLRRSADGLMERADTEATQALVGVLRRASDEKLITGYHQLRHRRVNDQVWVEYHLHFPMWMSLSEAHTRSHAVEEEVAALFPQDHVHVTAHLEPEHHDHPQGHREPEDPLSL